MAHRKLDRVQQVSTWAGSGALALDIGPPARMRSFASVMSNGDQCWVLIEHQTLNEWEISLATYNSGAIVRTFAAGSSSSTGGLVNFSNGGLTISLIAPAGATPIVDGGGNMSVPGGVSTGGGVDIAGTLVVHANTHDQVTMNQTNPAFNCDVNFKKAGVPHWLLSARFSETNDLRLFNQVRGQMDVNMSAAMGYVSLGLNTTPGARLHIQNTYHEFIFFDQTSPTTNNIDLHFARANVGKWLMSARFADGSDDFMIFNQGLVAPQILLKNATGDIEVLGHLRSASDNTKNLGGAGNRFATVFAGTGTINTSDENEKDGIRLLSAAEIAVGRRLAALVQIWQYKDALAEKGPDARLHSGWVAQRIVECFADEDLDAYRYGCVGSDLLEKSETYTVSVRRPKMETYTEAETYIDIVGGVPTLKSRSVERTRPAGVMVPVRDEAGAIVMIDTGGVDDGGEAILTPMMHFVSEEVDVEEERTRVVPDLDEGGVQKARLNVRPTELYAFVAAALNAALEQLDSRITALDPLSG